MRQFNKFNIGLITTEINQFEKTARSYKAVLISVKDKSILGEKRRKMIYLKIKE